MIRKYLVLSLTIFLLVLLGACSKIAVSPGEAVTEEPSCSGSDISAQDLPKEPSWTWLGITVGKSTEQDVIAIYGKPKRTRLWPPDQPEACILIYTLDDDSILNFWLAGDLVIGFGVGQPYPLRDFPIDAPRTLEEAKDLYGRAEIVGYSTGGYGARSVVWLRHGMQATVNIRTDDNSIDRILYFTPITEDEFHNSLWSGLVLDENPTLYPGSDVWDNAPKDPFEW